MLHLNFACGPIRWTGFENSDIEPWPGAVRVDLEERPYPYPDESASIILISHGLYMAPGGKPVHPQLGVILREFHRILAPGGWCRVDDNPLRCQRDGEVIPRNEIDAEIGRGYPPELVMRRGELVSILYEVGFTRVEEIPTGHTCIPSDLQTNSAILSNHNQHFSFTIEAQKSEVIW